LPFVAIVASPLATRSFAAAHEDASPESVIHEQIGSTSAVDSHASLLTPEIEERPFVPTEQNSTDDALGTDRAATNTDGAISEIAVTGTDALPTVFQTDRPIAKNGEERTGAQSNPDRRFAALETVPLPPERVAAGAAIPHRSDKGRDGKHVAAQIAGKLE